MSNFNPIRRSRVKWKPRQKKLSAPWRPERIRLDSKGMAELRSQAYARSGGICECGRPECVNGPQNLRRVTWYDGQLHHVISRARGGPDTLENVQFITRRCHAIITGELQWRKTG